MADVAVFTIGHSRHSFDTFAGLLKKHAIQVLIDARSRPQSRWVPWFNQKNLETAIPKIGIEYQWAGTLGGLPADQTFYKPNLNRKRKTDPATVADYDKIARQKWFQVAINQLLEVAKQRRTAIMCAEENPQECHRSRLIGQTLVKRGVKVLHIRKDGKLEPQTATESGETADIFESRPIID